MAAFVTGVTAGQTTFAREILGVEKKHSNATVLGDDAGGTSERESGFDASDLSSYRPLRLKENELRLSKLPAGVMGFATAYGIVNGDPTLYAEQELFRYAVLTAKDDDFEFVVYLSAEDKEKLVRDAGQPHSIVGYSRAFGDAVTPVKIRRSQLAQGTDNDDRVIGRGKDAVSAWDLVVSPRTFRRVRVVLEQLTWTTVQDLKNIGTLAAWEGDNGAVMISPLRWHSFTQATTASADFNPQVTLLHKPVTWSREEFGDANTLHVWVILGEQFATLPDAVWDEVGQHPFGPVELDGLFWHQLTGQEGLIESLDSALQKQVKADKIHRLILPFGYDGDELLGTAGWENAHMEGTLTYE